MTFTAGQQAFIEDRARAAKAQILHAILTGEPYANKAFTLPAIKRFSDLHELCDANTLGGWCLDEGRTPEMRDHLFPRRLQDETEGALWLDAANDSHGLVDAWIREGRMADDVAWLGALLDPEQVDCLLHEDRWLEAYGMVDDLEARVGAAHGFTPEACDRLRTFLPAKPLWLREHPRYGDETWITSVVDSISPLWYDSSWKNDTAPSFERQIGGTIYRVWLFERDPTDRELPSGGQFALGKHPEQNPSDWTVLLETDDWATMLDAMEKIGTMPDSDIFRPQPATPVQVPLEGRTFPSQSDAAIALLREVRQHFVYDPEGELTRAQFDALYRRIDDCLNPL